MYISHLLLNLHVTAFNETVATYSMLQQINIVRILYKLQEFFCNQLQYFAVIWDYNFQSYPSLKAFTVKYPYNMDFFSWIQMPFQWRKRCPYIKAISLAEAATMKFRSLPSRTMSNWTFWKFSWWGEVQPNWDKFEQF